MGVADVGQLAAHLRTRDALIVCGPDTVTVKEPEFDDPEPVSDDQAAPSQLILPFPSKSPWRSAPTRSGQGNQIRKPERTNPHRDPPNVNDLFGG